MDPAEAAWITYLTVNIEGGQQKSQEQNHNFSEIFFSYILHKIIHGELKKIFKLPQEGWGYGSGVTPLHGWDLKFKPWHCLPTAHPQTLTALPRQNMLWL